MELYLKKLKTLQVLRNLQGFFKHIFLNISILNLNLQKFIKFWKNYWTKPSFMELVPFFQEWLLSCWILCISIILIKRHSPFFQVYILGSPLLILCLRLVLKPLSLDFLPKKKMKARHSTPLFGSYLGFPPFFYYSF